MVKIKDWLATQGKFRQEMSLARSSDSIKTFAELLEAAEKGSADHVYDMLEVHVQQTNVLTSQPFPQMHDFLDRDALEVYSEVVRKRVEVLKGLATSAGFAFHTTSEERTTLLLVDTDKNSKLGLTFKIIFRVTSKMVANTVNKKVWMFHAIW